MPAEHLMSLCSILLTFEPCLFFFALRRDDVKLSWLVRELVCAVSVPLPPRASVRASQIALRNVESHRKRTASNQIEMGTDCTISSESLTLCWRVRG